MKTTTVFRILFLLAAAVFGNLAVRAEDLATLKARIEQRSSAVTALKVKLVAGEDNRGFLAARGVTTAADERTISDENSDRRAVYVALAGQTGAKADQVGRQRAQQLAQLAKRGMWIQDVNGQWEQKQ
jgi:uncharacterized protein